MSYVRKDLGQSQVELTITVTPAEYQKNLEQAAKKISTSKTIKGFRPGKASYDIVKKEFGDMAILQEALDEIVKESYFTAVISEKLDTLGMPQVSLEKVAPDNDVVYKAIVAVVPKVTLPEISKIEVKRNPKPVEDKQVSETIQALRGMQAKEEPKAGAATAEDKLVIDMDMILDNVPVDGGQAKDYQVYLSEPHYIPGFNDHLIGLKKDEKKEFMMKFPKDHYQKHIADKDVLIKVQVKDVVTRNLPEVNEAFAKMLGQESIKKLEDLIRDNLTREAHEKATQTAEIEILEKLIEGSTFEPIPEVLINSERQKMFHELKRDLDKNGIAIEKYLEDIKKTEKDLFEDFKAQAEKRAKAALVSRQIAMDNQITVSDDEVDAEIDMIIGMYGNNPTYQENAKRPEVRDTIATSLQNKKVMDWLKAKVLGDDLINDKNLNKLANCCNHDHKENESCDHDHDHDHK